MYTFILLCTSLYYFYAYIYINTCTLCVLLYYVYNFIAITLCVPYNIFVHLHFYYVHIPIIMHTFILNCVHIGIIVYTFILLYAQTLGV